MSKAPFGKRVLLALAAVTLAFSVVPQVAFAQEVVGPPPDPVRDEQSFVDAINETRAKVNLPALTVHPGLVDVARSWAVSMRKAHVTDPLPEGKCRISHNPDLAKALPKQWTKLGENVGCGNADVAYIHNEFVKSQHHYENMVNPDFDMVGIGIVFEGETMFVTEQFMKSAKTPTPVPNELALAPGAKQTKVLSASVQAPTNPATKGRKPVKAKKSKAASKAKPAAPAPL
jgi:uncharacterized protein YkwD